MSCVLLTLLLTPQYITRLTKRLSSHEFMGARQGIPAGIRMADLTEDSSDKGGCFALVNLPRFACHNVLQLCLVDWTCTLAPLHLCTSSHPRTLSIVRNPLLQLLRGFSAPFMHSSIITITFVLDLSPQFGHNLKPPNL